MHKLDKICISEVDRLSRRKAKVEDNIFDLEARLKERVLIKSVLNIVKNLSHHLMEELRVKAFFGCSVS